jgi:hypothetical protein
MMHFLFVSKNFIFLKNEYLKKIKFNIKVGCGSRAYRRSLPAMIQAAANPAEAESSHHGRHVGDVGEGA